MSAPLVAGADRASGPTSPPGCLPELLTVAGEIRNLTDEVQRVPQIRADLVDARGNIVYSWPIAPPVRELQPRQAVPFNSASTGVPPGGRNLNLSFGPLA